jgi:CRISPR-associated endonuclease Cas1 subtype II
VYFNALFGKSFTITEDSPVTAALNYVYSILLSMFNREVVANGYITQQGLFYNNMFNQFNLASDLMEPFRPIVDRKVLGLRPEKFEIEEKHSMLEMVEEEVVIDNRKEFLGNAVKIYIRSVLDAINDRDVSKISFFEL